jgi:iron complex outermembrane receptor protein
MDSPSSYITPQNFDSLTVIKGPQTVLWGPGASAATILFEREPENFTELGGRVDASLLAGSEGRFDSAIDAATGSSQGYLRLLANHSTSNDYQDGNGDEVHSQWEKWSSDLVLGWTPTADTLVELTVGTGDGEAAYAGRGMDGSQFERESLALRVAQENIGEVLQKVEARVYYNYADHVMDNFTLRDPDPAAAMAMMRNPAATNVDRRTLGGRLAGTWQWSAYELVAGVDAQTNEHRKRASTFNMMTQVYTDYDEFGWTKDAEFSQYGLFAELTRELSERQKVISGVRIDRAQATDERLMFNSHHPTATDPVTGKPISMNWANPSAGETRRDTLYSGFLRYEHGLASLPATAYVGLGHSQRFPDYWELFSASPGPVGSIQAFETVEPEKTTQLDVGIQYAKGPLEAWASAYVGQVNDYIMFNYVPGMMPGMTRSIATNIDARIAGAELGGSYKLTDNWKADASLAYAWGENTTDERAMPQIPPLEARFGLGYERGNWSAAGLWRVVAAQTRVAEGQGNVTSKDFDESTGFGVLSLNAAYRVNENFKLSAGVDNVLDKAYSEHLNQAGNAGVGMSADERINEPGRSLWARLDVSF